MKATCTVLGVVALVVSLTAGCAPPDAGFGRVTDETIERTGYRQAAVPPGAAASGRRDQCVPGSGPADAGQRARRPAAARADPLQ